MSDLCHNCGDCHLGVLPSPCKLPLRQCLLCKAQGHTYNFCPAGVKHIEPDYQYWMLCHNCDKWHLPQPCGMPMQLCEACQNFGHLPSFCPVDPKARVVKTGENVSHAGTKRRRVSSEPGEAQAQAQAREVAQIHPQLLEAIRYDAVLNAMRMLENHTAEQVVARFAPAQAQFASPAGIARFASTQAQSASPAAVPSPAAGTPLMPVGEIVSENASTRSGTAETSGDAEFKPPAKRTSKGKGVQATLTRCKECVRRHKATRDCTHLGQKQEVAEATMNTDENAQGEEIVPADEATTSDLGNTTTFDNFSEQVLDASYGYAPAVQDPEPVMTTKSAAKKGGKKKTK